MARILNCEFSLDTEEMAHISHQARDFVSRLLLTDSSRRWGCLQDSRMTG